MSHRDVIVVAGALSLALTAAAAAQNGGLITTAPKSEDSRVRVDADDLLAEVPLGDGPFIDPGGVDTSLISGGAARANSTPSLLAVPKPAPAPRPEPPAPLGKIKGIGPFGLIIPKNGERLPVEPEPQGPPPTVGPAKAAPLCVVEGVLIACGSTPPGD